MRSPESTPGSTRARRSTLASAATGGIEIVCDISEASTPPDPHCASSMLAIIRWKTSVPATPPYSSGNPSPSSPIEAACA